MAENKVTYDVDGYDAVTAALRTLLAQYPGLAEGEGFDFASLDEDGGKAIYPGAGAVIESQRVDILGHVHQVCTYPFLVLLRKGNPDDDRAAATKEWLDTLGRWLEKQPVNIGGEEYKLSEYPPLTGEREMTEIRRTSTAYLYGTNENQSEDWIIYLSARYANDFDR